MAGAFAARIAAGEVKCISRCLGKGALRGQQGSYRRANFDLSVRLVALQFPQGPLHV